MLRDKGHLVADRRLDTLTDSRIQISARSAAHSILSESRGLKEARGFQASHDVSSYATRR